MPTRAKAIKIAGWYFGLSCVWIFSSGWLLHHLVHDAALAAWLEDVKGWFFVAVTALMLGWVLQRSFRQIHQSAARLLEEESRLRLIGDNLPDSYVFQYLLDPQGQPRFTYVSAGVARVHGRPPAEVLRDAHCLLDQMDPDQRQLYAAAEAESAAGLKDFQMELRVRLPDGQQRLILVHSRPARTTEGLVRWDGIVTDVTSQRDQEAARLKAEKSLQDSARLLHTVINLVPHPIFAKDRQSRYFLANRACAAVHGLAPEQVLGRTDLEINANRTQAEALMRVDREVIDTGERRFIPEVALANAVGQCRILQVIKIPFASPTAGPAVLGVAVDITEVKRSEQNYREIFNATNEAIFLHDAATGAVLEVNDAVLRMFGYDSKEEFLAKGKNTLTADQSPYTWDQAMERIRLAIERGPQVFEWLNRKKNGEPVWVEVSLRNTQIGGQGRVLAVVRDITERKAQQMEIERLTRLYVTLSEVNQTIVRSPSRAELFAGICQVMVEYGRFRGARIAEWTGPDDALKVVAECQPDPPLELVPGLCEVAAEVLGAGRAALCNQWGTDERARCCRQTVGGTGIGSCAAFPLTQQGRLTAVFSVCSSEANFFQSEEVRLLEEIGSDISFALDRLVAEDRRRVAEAELHELNRTLDQRVQERTAELRASNEELDAFAYAVSHDLRAPLRAMSGFSQALTEDFGPQLPAAAHEYLGHIRTGSREMGALIDGLLRLSRSTRGTLQRTSVNLSALATHLLGELQQGEPHRRVACTVDAGLTANGDAHLLEIALRNLLGNAWKYTAHSPQALIHVHGRTDPKSTTFCVSDNGAGFDMKHAAKLFQPFQRLHRDDEFPGIGIGLATVQRIIRRHGGTLEATGAPGAGAHFSFTLPGS